MKTQPLELVRGERVVIPCHADPAETNPDLTAITLSAFFSTGFQPKVNPSLTLITDGGITGQDVNGNFFITITRDQTLNELGSAMVYRYQVWDMTNDRVIAKGEVYFDPSIRPLV